MKQSRYYSILTSLLMAVGLITFIPSMPAQAEANCSGATCTETFNYTGSVQTFTPASPFIELTITLNGGSGGNAGGDAGGPGGTGFGGSKVVFKYVHGSTTPLNLYIGNKGGNASGGAGVGTAGAAGTNPWSAYNGGRGGGAGPNCCSGGGGGGGAATLITTGTQSGVIAVAGGGGGGGGAHISSNGLRGGNDSGSRASATSGNNGADHGGDGSGGGGGGGGVQGGAGGWAANDGGGAAGGGYTGTSSFPADSSGVKTLDSNTAAGSITISWANGPIVDTRPSFTPSSPIRVGQVLTPATGSYTPRAGSLTVANPRWQISTDGITWTDLSPLVNGNYTIAKADAGKYLRVAQDATDQNSTTFATSIPSAQITDVPVFTDETPPANALVDNNYVGYTFVASGYRVSYSISSGSLPSGISLNSTSGVLSGKPTSTGIFTFKVKATNDSGSDETVNLSLTVGRSPVFTSDDSVLQSVNRVTNPIRVGTALTNFVFTTAAFPAASYELKTDSATIPACTVFAQTCASSFETLGLPEGLSFNAGTGTLSGTPTKTGAYVFAIKATNSLGSAVEFIHMSIAAKAPLPFTLSSDKNAVTIIQNSTVTALITATGGSGNGAYSFSVDPASSAICSVSTTSANSATMTVLAAGNCVINGTKAADGGFASAKSSITIPVNKAAQSSALTITTDIASFIYGAANTWVRGSGGSGSGAFSWAIDPTTAGNCTVGTLSGNNMYLSNPLAGNCLLVVTKAGDAYFLPQTTKFLVKVEKAQITGLAVSQPNTANWNASVPPSVTLSTTGGQGTGAVSFALDPASSNNCSLVGNVLTAKSAGSCLVTATKAGDNNYNPMTSPAVSWTINPINQPALSTTAVNASSAALAYNGQVLYIANPAVLALLTTTGGAGTGSFSYVASNSSNCVVAGAGATAYVSAAASGPGIGWCTITITKNADTNYAAQTTTFQFSIQPGPQSTLVATPEKSSIDFIASTLTDSSTAATTQLTITGGLGTGAISYAVATASQSVCSVNATGLITNKTAGSCVVNVTKAADSNYLVQNTSATVTFNKLSQAELVAEPASSTKPFTWSPKATTQITLSGGTGTGATSYAVATASVGICSVSGSGLITSITAGNCVVNITKAADTNYLVATDQVQVTFSKVDPSAITLTSSPASLVYTPLANKNKAWVSFNGGNYSSGAINFYVDPMTEEYCSITAVQPTQVQIAGNLAGLCLIIVVQNADVNYNEQRAYIGVNITKATQTIGATSSVGTTAPFKLSPDVTTTINVTGQSGTGTTRYVVDSANNSSNCSVDQATGNVTSTTVGTCRVTVSRDGDSNVLDSNSVVLNITISKTNQTLMTVSPTADFKLAAVGSPAATSILTFGTSYTGTGNFTKIVSTTTSVCTITGGGDSTLATPTFTPTTDLKDKITVTAVNDGTCTLVYSKLGDANFNAATNSSISFIINKATQAEISAALTVGSASMPFVATPKATATVTGSGGSGTGVFNYSVDPSSSGICAVNLTSGVVTDVTAGTCQINVKRIADNDYADSAVKSVTITFTKIDQAAFTVAAAKTALKAPTSGADSTTLSVTGGSGTGAVTYTVAADSLTVCSISGGTVTGIGPGDCNIIATKAADVNYNLATSSIKLTVTKGTQAALSAYWWYASPQNSPVTFNPSTDQINYFVTSGGSGSGDLVATIDPASANICGSPKIRPSYPNQIIVTALGDGECKVSVYKSGGNLWDNSNVVTASFWIGKANQQAISVAASKSTLTYFNSPNPTFTVSVTGGSGSGAYGFTISQASASVCSDATVAGGQLTVRAIGVGNCVITGTKAASAGYTAVTATAITVTITKGTQAALVAAASPATLNFSTTTAVTSTVSITGGSGSGTITIAVDSGSTAVCKINSQTLVITAITPGWCELTVTKAADALFNVQTAKLRVEIQRTAQTKLNLAATYPQLLYTEENKPTTPLTLSGGSGTGAISYAVDPGAASICNLSYPNGVPTITATYYGFCTVTATKAGDNIYAPITASTIIKIALAGTQIAATVPSTTVGFVPAPANVSTVTVVGSLPGDVLSYSVDNSSKTVCSVAGTSTIAQVTSLSTGTCSILVINVAKAPDGTLIASSAVVNLTITKGEQSNVVATPAAPSIYFATPAATNVITVTGGLTNTAITASVSAETNANCSVTVAGNKVTMTALKVGDCVITVTKAGNTNFNDSVTTLTIPILKTKQANLVASASPSSLTYKANELITSTISVTGGSGTGLVSYELNSASVGICSIEGNIITVITGGDCIVNVTKDGDNNYSPAQTSVTVKIAKSDQDPLSLTADDQTLTYDKNSPVSTLLDVTGGSGTGEISYAVSPSSAAICSLDGAIVNVLRPGNCVVNATKAADGFYNSASTSVTITINKAEQESLIWKITPGKPETPQWNDKNSTQVIITGGDGYGALSTNALTPTICSITLVGQRVNITALREGECEFTVIKAGDYAFNASAALTVSVEIASAATDLAVSIATLGDATAGKNAAIEIAIENKGSVKAAGATVNYLLPTGISIRSPLPNLCTLTSSDEVTCLTTNVLLPGAKIRFTILIALAASLVGGEFTENGEVELSSATPDNELENNSLTGEDANFIVNKAPVAFVRSTLNGMQTGKDFEDQIEAIGYPAVRYTIIEGDLPAGLSLDESTGEISGIPTGVGKYSFTVSAYNTAGSVSQVFTGTIAPAPFVTIPGVGFATNTVPAGTKVTITGINLNLITSAILGGKSVTILTKTATQIVIQVPSATQAGEVPISLVYPQGTIEAGYFTYTGVAKKTPVLTLNRGVGGAGAGEQPRTLTASATAEGVDGDLDIPFTYISRTPAVCTVAANKVSFLGAGTCTLAVSTAASAAFNAATSPNATILVSKSTQSLVVVAPKDTTPPTPTTDSADGFDLEVTATSGLAPIFTSSTPTICDATEDGHVTGLALGKCVVSVSQPGDARFAAAPVTQMDFMITADPGLPAVDNGDPLRPTSLAGGSLTKLGDVGFTWNKKLAALSVETYGIWIGKINAVSEFTIAGKNYKCSVDFGILKAMASKTPAQLKAAMAKKVFKASAPFCNVKTEAAAFSALKKGFAGLQVKVTITRYRMYPTTYKPINAKTKKPITTQIRTVYLTLG